jgi:hypothetical protein
LTDVSGVYWSGVTAVSGLSRTLSVNVIAGSYRMTSQFSTYWYGYWGDVTMNHWSQIDHDITSLTGIDNDTAMSISWQNSGIGAQSSSLISFLIRSGNHYVDKPILSILGEPDAILVGSSIGSHVFIWDSIPTSLMNISPIIASDISNITLVASDHLPNIDEIGGSLTTGLCVTVIASVTDTPRKSALATASAVASLWL